MDSNLLLRLETLVDRLLAVVRELEDERDRLQGENRELLEEKRRVRDELDRILLKLDALERESS